jgi:hypothetical protein
MTHHDPFPSLPQNCTAELVYNDDDGTHLVRGRLRRNGHSVRVGNVRIGHGGIALDDVVRLVTA